jgi:Phage integrase family
LLSQSDNKQSPCIFFGQIRFEATALLRRPQNGDPLVSHGPELVAGLSKFCPWGRDSVSACPKFFPATFGFGQALFECWTATIKQHMAAIRMMFSWLTEKGILAMNPAREVKTPKFSRNEGKTPAPPAEEVQKLIDSIDLNHVVGLRDQAILGVLTYTFARIGAVVSLQVKDYFQVGKRSVLRFNEKGGKEKEIPVHHKLEEMLDCYLDASGLRGQPDSPLFLAARGKTHQLSDRAIDRVAAWMGQSTDLLTDPFNRLHSQRNPA